MTQSNRDAPLEIRKLNALRGIAAFIVLISHYSNDSGFLSPWLGYGAGQIGVMLFFCLSGFLMSYLYIDETFSPRTVSNYLIARAARVLPLYLFVILLSYGLQKAGIDGIFYQINSLSILLSHLIFLQGTFILWTIPVEIHFYMTFIIFWWFWKKKQFEFLIFIFFLIAFISYFNFPHAEGQVLGLQYNFLLARALSYFLTGLLFGIMFKHYAIQPHLQSNIYLLALLIIPLLYPNIYYSLTGQTHEIWQDLQVLLSVALVFFSIIFLVPDKNPFLVNRIGDFLGKISYSLYLLHVPVLWQIQPYAKTHPGLFLPIFIALTIVISYLSFTFLENPVRLSLRKTFLDKA